VTSQTRTRRWPKRNRSGGRNSDDEVLLVATASWSTDRLWKWVAGYLEESVLLVRGAFIDQPVNLFVVGARLAVDGILPGPKSDSSVEARKTPPGWGRAFRQ